MAMAKKKSEGVVLQSCVSDPRWTPPKPPTFAVSVSFGFGFVMFELNGFSSLPMSPSDARTIARALQEAARKAEDSNGPD